MDSATMDSPTKKPQQSGSALDATLDEILRILGVQSRGELENLVSRMAADALQDRPASGGPRVAFACGVWSDLLWPLKPAFREAVVGTYKAEANTVDFRGAPEEACGQINAWAAQVTNNLIDSILPPGSINPATTRLVLGNAVYFKGKWSTSRSTAGTPRMTPSTGSTAATSTFPSCGAQCRSSSPCTTG
ncbi:putative serpin-Z8 [Hordeum vulgare]|nr:putative serpin-Z8 [Hordeum vulgare]